MKVTPALRVLFAAVPLVAVAQLAVAQEASFTLYCGACHTSAAVAALVAKQPVGQRAEYLSTRILARHAPVAAESRPGMVEYLLAAAPAAAPLSSAP